MDQHSRFNNKILSAAIIVLFLIGLFWLIGYAIQFFLLIFTAILMAVMLRAGTNFLKRKFNLPDWAGLTISLFTFLIVLGGIFTLIIPTVANQAAEVREQLPEAWSNIESTIKETELGKTLFERVEENKDDLIPEDEKLMQYARSFFAGTFGVIGDLLVIFIMGIFFAASPQLYVQGVVVLAAPRFRRRLEDVLNQVYLALKAWLLGKFIAMLFIGIATAIGLMLFGVPAPFALGFLAFLMDFIPNIGPILASIPAVLLAFLVSPMTALWVGIFFLVIQQFESYVLVPYIYKKTVSISPVITLASLILLGILAGPLGVIMATPLVAVIQVMLRELYIKDYLEKDLDEKDDNSFEKRMEDV
ncbi:AI-2E family transporter [Litoribacter ruber]|uniref:AI-2E family transporter n=1 Tax=Litoribacter ruber TaxID=702568 RepID=UPI001BD92E60|nr:AI-2E family transporter [Litoribacter ruber]MBT0812712.1 AI-2E family transporter [Litoribacter ruber]